MGYKNSHVEEETPSSVRLADDELLAVDVVSGIGLVKACRRHDVPIPPRDHGIKIEFGKPMTCLSLSPVIAGLYTRPAFEGASERTDVLKAK
jgi:hypothetical protein